MSEPAAGPQPPLPPPLAPPTNRTWREQAITTAAQLRTLAEWVSLIDPPAGAPPGQASAKTALDHAITWHLNEASTVAEQKSPAIQTSFNGAVVERVLSQLDAAQVALLLRAPLDYVQSQLPGIQAHARQHLKRGDPHRVAVEDVVAASLGTPLDESGRMTLVAAFRASCLESREEFSRVRSFRNVLIMGALVLTVLATALAVAGWIRPEELRLCFEPAEGVACPTGNRPRPWDVFFIESFGLIAAAVSGAASLRHVRGTSTPFGLPLALAILKLPAGALTAVLGLQLMRGGFVPGLSDLDNPAQIVAWAITFGAAQQLFTGLVDRQAQNVLDDVGGKTGGTANTNGP
ncbi:MULTISPECIES: hypothetical protein [unclassified Arthrobacter]|uniref:hypothetical protein n=1 Tax=unclassified Arthrobacter TaxID=235627 RepID=UPI0004145D64|nr:MULTISPECIES: hypothetical protein [unclassified Arthrobacter]PVE17000.1 hypothetical protein DDA93_11480 [Arthrobacter sp. Bz4]